MIEIDLQKDPVPVNNGRDEDAAKKVVRCAGAKKKKCPMSFYIAYSMLIGVTSIRKAE